MPGGDEERMRNSLVCKIAHANGKLCSALPYEATPAGGAACTAPCSAAGTSLDPSWKSCTKMAAHAWAAFPVDGHRCR